MSLRAKLGFDKGQHSEGRDESVQCEIGPERPKSPYCHAPDSLTDPEEDEEGLAERDFAEAQAAARIKKKTRMQLKKKRAAERKLEAMEEEAKRLAVQKAEKEEAKRKLETGGGEATGKGERNAEVSETQATAGQESTYRSPFIDRVSVVLRGLSGEELRTVEAEKSSEQTQEYYDTTPGDHSIHAQPTTPQPGEERRAEWNFGGSKEEREEQNVSKDQGITIAGLQAEVKTDVSLPSSISSPTHGRQPQRLNIVGLQAKNASTLPPITSALRKSLTLTMTGEKLPSPSPPPPVWEHFVARRAELLQEAIRDSVNTGTFNNVDLYAYCKRSKTRFSRFARKPAVVHARTSFLEASSPVLKDFIVNKKKQLGSIPSAKYDYEYLDDSDLEDEKPEVDEYSGGKASDISDIASNVSMSDLLDSPRSTVHTVIDMEGRDARSPSTTENVSGEGARDEVIYAHFGAARTWRALVLYLYDGRISFSPLQTSITQAKCQDDVSCSPKSMYQLAKKLELDELAELCEEAIVADLCSTNIIKELFSDFTWRHPAILDREVVVFMNYAQDLRVRLALKEACRDMASGKLPRRDVVLSALFDNMLPPTVWSSNVY